MFPLVQLRKTGMLLALSFSFVSTQSALAHDSQATGGAAAPETPEVLQLRCDTGEAEQCPRGQVLRVAGENLDTTRAVIFLGARGKRDDREAHPAVASPHRVIVRVPKGARTGSLRVVSSRAGVSSPSARLKILSATAAGPSPASQPATVEAGPGVFPISGAYDFGTATNRFGGGRGHQGQDVFAKCGTPLVAALGGTVTLRRFHERAGNYVVIKAADGTSQAYMHMLERALVAKGDVVAAGTQIGLVGETGRASGCHLHFEHWTAPGWYEGGEAIDPLPLLKSLAAAKR